MAVTKKQDNKNNNKKEQGKKDTITKDTTKETGKKDLVLSKGKKDLVKKDSGKKEPAVKKDKVNRLETAQKFFRGVLNELKKVHWPTRREVVIYTTVVFVAVVAVGAMIWVFDFALSSILRPILQR